MAADTLSGGRKESVGQGRSKRRVATNPKGKRRLRAGRGDACRGAKAFSISLHNESGAFTRPRYAARLTPRLISACSFKHGSQLHNAPRAGPPLREEIRSQVFSVKRPQGEELLKTLVVGSPEIPVEKAPPREGLRPW